MRRFVRVGPYGRAEPAAPSPGLGRSQLTVLGVIAIAGLVGGVALAILALVTFFAAGGGGVLGLVMALTLGLAEFVLGALAFISAALLLRAIRVLEAPGFERVPGGLGAHAGTRLAAAAVFVCWIVPAVLTSRSDSAGSADAMLSAIGVGIGLVQAATAFATRDLLRRPLGVVMLAIPLASVALPLWVGSSMAAYQGRQDTYAAERAHYRERFAEILGGPTIEEVAARVGDVGGWRVIGGSITPMERADPFLNRQGSVNDLGGAAVQVALVAQCTADYDGGQLVGYADVFGNRRANGDPIDSQYVDFPVVPCDGALHLRLSDIVTLPNWDAFTLDGVGGWQLVMTGAVMNDATPTPGEHNGRVYAESGARWLFFVAAAPAPPAESLLRAVGAQLGPLRAR